MKLVANRPHIIVVIGIPGSGKTYFAERFSNSFSAPLFSVSKLRALLNDNSSTTKSSDLLKYLLLEMLKTKHTIVFDGHIYSKTDRNKLNKTVQAVGYSPLFVWVQTDLTTAKKRFIKTKQSVDFEELLEKFDQPELDNNVVVISGKHNYKTQLSTVLKKLASVQPTTTTPQANRKLAKKKVLIR